jgi:hypothetical protein
MSSGAPAYGLWSLVLINVAVFAIQSRQERAGRQTPNREAPGQEGAEAYLAGPATGRYATSPDKSA